MSRTNPGSFFKVCAEEQQYLFIQANAVALRANRHFQAMGITVAVSGYLPGIQVACLRVTGNIITGAVLIGPAINAGNPIQVWQAVNNTVGIYCLAGSFMVNAIDDDKVFGTVREGESGIPAAVIRSCPGINLYGGEVGRIPIITDSIYPALDSVKSFRQGNISRYFGCLEVFEPGQNGPAQFLDSRQQV